MYVQDQITTFALGSSKVMAHAIGKTTMKNAATIEAIAVLKRTRIASFAMEHNAFAMRQIRSIAHVICLHILRISL